MASESKRQMKLDGTRCWPYALPIVLLIYVLLVIGYTLRTPAWQAPDEPAHWNYIAHIAELGCCPRLVSGDWDSELLAELTSQRFENATANQLNRLRYENHHPPLYYALATPIFRRANGDILALRLWSALLGLGIVVNAYRCGRLLAPRRPALAALTALFVACLPQHLHLLASVNNDALAWLLISQTTYVCLGYLHRQSLRREGQSVAALMMFGGAFLFLTGGETRWLGALMVVVGAAQLWLHHHDDARADCWLLGCLIGLIFITKTTAYLMLPLALATVWLRLDRREALRLAGWLLLPAALLGASWWLRNIAVYGFPDALGLLQHNRVVVGQPRSSEWILERGLLAYLGDMLRITYTSFWGQFGWMALPLNGWRLLFTLAMSGVAACGGLVVAFRSSLRSPSGRLLFLQCAFTGGMFIAYNLAFVQWQGRYFYPALIPMALAWAWGALYLLHRFGRWANWLALALAASLPLFALEIMLRVLPGLYP